jgi:hypothetical protein
MELQKVQFLPRGARSLSGMKRSLDLALTVFNRSAGLHLSDL